MNMKMMSLVCQACVQPILFHFYLGTDENRRSSCPVKRLWDQGARHPTDEKQVFTLRQKH